MPTIPDRATPSLDVRDSPRYARGQRDRTAGQALGLLATMPPRPACTGPAHLAPAVPRR